MFIFQFNDLILKNTYRIERTLGQGAFGEVYMAAHLKLGSFRAIKVVKKGDNGLGSREFTKYTRTRSYAKSDVPKANNHPYLFRILS